MRNAPQSLDALWNAASRKCCREALAHLRDAYEADALGDMVKIGTKLNR